MVKIAQMYYEKDMKQDQIAKELGAFRNTKIREEGIVKISINYSASKTSEIEQELINKLGLKDAFVAPSESGESPQANTTFNW